MRAGSRRVAKSSPTMRTMRCLFERRMVIAVLGLAVIAPASGGKLLGLQTAAARGGSARSGATAKTTQKSSKDEKAVRDAQVLLSSSDHDEIEAGIQSLGLLGSPAAVEPIVARIRAGLPADLLEISIVTLMALSQPKAAPVYFELIEHRRPEVRVRTIEAFVALKPAGTEQALQKALDDLDPKVRSAAALALGELRATGSIEVLFRALDRGTFEASQAIGQALHAEQIPRLLGYLGSIPFHSLAPAFSELLLRKDISEKDKLRVVSRLQDVGTHEVKGYFGELSVHADKLPPAVHRAILRAMQEIAD